MFNLIKVNTIFLCLITCFHCTDFIRLRHFYKVANEEGDKFAVKIDKYRISDFTTADGPKESYENLLQAHNNALKELTQEVIQGAANNDDGSLDKFKAKAGLYRVSVHDEFELNDINDLIAELQETSVFVDAEGWEKLKNVQFRLHYKEEDTNKLKAVLPIDDGIILLEMIGDDLSNGDFTVIEYDEKIFDGHLYVILEAGNDKDEANALLSENELTYPEFGNEHFATRLRILL